MARKKRISARIEPPEITNKKDLENEDRFNCLPLLLIPIFFTLGWSMHEAVTGKTQMYDNRQQVGIGGGPENGTYCITPRFAP